MQFSDVSGKQGIIQDISFLLGGIGLNAYTIEDRTRNVNLRFSQVWSIIFKSYGGWQFIDSNTSDATTGVPYTDSSLSLGIGLYPLPSAALTVGEVSILTSSSSRQPLIGLTHEQFTQMGGDAAFLNTTGVPIYYLLQGDVMRLLPIPNYSLSNSLRIYYDQNVASFLTTDTTKVPGFAEPYHRLLSIGGALDYAEARGLNDRIIALTKKWDSMEYEMRGFYNRRFKARYPARIPPARDLAREFS